MMLLQVASMRSLAPARYIAAMKETVVEAGPIKLHWQSTKRGFSSDIGSTPEIMMVQRSNRQFAKVPPSRQMVIPLNVWSFAITKASPSAFPGYYKPLCDKREGFRNHFADAKVKLAAQASPIMLLIERGVAPVSRRLFKVTARSRLENFLPSSSRISR
jgi:hypothetical protein